MTTWSGRGPRLASLVCLIWCAAWAGCGARGDRGDRGGPEERPARSSGTAAAPVAAERAPPAPVDSGGPDLSPLQAPLQPEPPEADPRSTRVRLKLVVLPVDAEVFWGRKRLGVAGRRPLELERPRDSGPLDVVVRAPGYLPFNTRLHTDRDDTLTVRLVPPAQARGLLGWKPSVAGAAPSARSGAPTH
jgi:hypothetical protein